MAARKRTRRTVMPSPRSAKAGRPPREVPASPKVRRRRKTVTTAVRKGTLVQQTDMARVWWGVGKPKEKKR